MSNVTSVGNKLTRLDVAPRFPTYSKVIINISKTTAVEAGDNTGRVLEIDNPFGTQEMANNILRSLGGYRYQPYDAKGAVLDPAAEMGDAANIRGNYCGIYTRSRTFGRMMKADISAPYEEEIDHEYQFESSTDRKFTREIGEVRATLNLQNDAITAKVSKTENNESFGWQLLSDHWSVVAGGEEVFRIDQYGGTFTGQVVAAAGKIGGFDIGEKSIHNNISTFGGSQSDGVYIGTDGIQLGQSFKVTSSGKVTASDISANNMTLTGTLNVGGSYISAGNLYSGAASAFSNKTYWSNGSSYGYKYNKATIENNGEYPTYFRASVIDARTRISIGGFRSHWGSITVDGHTYKVLMQGAG